MNKKIIRKLIALILTTVMMINVVILIRIRLLMFMDPFYREKKAEYILPEGFAPAKEKISWDESLLEPSGWVVRYVSRECIYCKLDYEWERLVPQLERLNYRTILLLTKEADQLNQDQVVPKSAQQIAFIKMDWIKQFRFNGTPTVVIFDKNGRVLWHHTGIMNIANYKSAENVILKNAKG